MTNVTAPRRQSRLLGVPGLLIMGLLATTALIVCLGLGGGAPAPDPDGLPDPGLLTRWGLPVAQLLSRLSSVAVVGMLLTPTLLLPVSRAQAQLEGPSARLVFAVRWFAAGWAAAVATQFLLTVSDLLALPMTDLGLSDVASSLAQTSQGRALALQFVTTVLVAVASRWVLSVNEAMVLLAVSIFALMPPIITGHSAASGAHDLAIVSLLVHVVTISLWVGGLASVTWVTAMHPRNVVLAVTRYSALAAWCLGIVLVSGIANAAVRIGGFAALVDTGYGRLVLVKAVALGGLGAFGVAHRRRTIPAIRHAPEGSSAWQIFRRVASAEIGLMVVAVGIAVALSRTPTPVGDDVYASDAEFLLGGSVPAAPTIFRLLLAWTPSGVGFLVVGLGTALYAAGLLAMRRRGDRWPPGRAISWFTGLAIVGWATFGGLGLYSHVLFSAHMASHMLLSMVAPIFLVLGAPVTLALRTLPGPRVPGERGLRQLLIQILHSRFVRFSTHPLVATALFVGGLYALYFTGLFPWLMQSHLGHAAMQTHFLLSGSLFFYVLVGIDPSPRKLPALARMGIILVVIPFHAFFSIAIMSSATILGGDFYERIQRPYRTDLLADQYLGGSLSWAFGEIPIIAVVAAIFVSWLRSDMRESRRHDRREAARREGESDLDEYNRYLASLSSQSTRSAHDESHQR